VASKIFEWSVRNLLHVKLLAPRILKSLPDIWKICAPLVRDLSTYLLVNHSQLLLTSETCCRIQQASMTTKLDTKSTKPKSRRSSDDTAYLYSENPTFGSRTRATSIMSEVWREAWFSSDNKTQHSDSTLQ